MCRHIQAKHTSNEEKNFKCEFCGKGFIRQAPLTDHMNIHTGEKPYLCSICGTSFAANGNLSMHQRTVHFGYKKEKKKNLGNTQCT